MPGPLFAITIKKASKSRIAGVLIALDRQEKGLQDISAVQEVERQLHLPVRAIIGLADIVTFLQQGNSTAQLESIREYQSVYGI